MADVKSRKVAVLDEVTKECLVPGSLANDKTRVGSSKSGGWLLSDIHFLRKSASQLISPEHFGFALSVNPVSSY